MTGRIATRIVGQPTEPIVRRLSSLASLSEAELDAIRRLGERRDRHRPGDELCVEGEAARRPRFVVSGWASAQRVLSDGRRQIFGFALPGDALGLYPRMSPPALYSVVATTAMETVDAQPLLELVRNNEAPGLLRAFAAATRAEDAMLLDQIVRLGRQTAYERVAHFLLELQDRLTVVGLGDKQHFPLPLTQEILADVLGLSIVHINRTLQQLRRDRLIEWRSGVAVLLQRDLLVSIADYKLGGAPAGGIERTGAK